MKTLFKYTRFQKKSLLLIDHCNTIIDNYLAEGLKLTLRQLYYQLVTKNLIPNEERAYKNVGGLVSKGRLSGLVDWDAIEDRVRRPVVWSQSRNIKEAVRDVLLYYRLPRLQGQSNYVELWVEKDALAGVLRPVASQFHVTMMVNRGYSSSSAMYEAAQRLEGCLDRYGSDYATILYLGDLDPSGEDMVRDIRDRLELFTSRHLEVKKIALNMSQVEHYNPPPNPTKLTDTRAKEFIRKFGRDSWEVDAIPPKELQNIITREIVSRLDLELMDKIKQQEDEDKRGLGQALELI